MDLQFCRLCGEQLAGKRQDNICPDCITVYHDLKTRFFNDPEGLNEAVAAHFEKTEKIKERMLADRHAGS